MTHKGAWVRIGAVLMMSGLLLTACGSSNKATPPSTTKATSTGGAAQALRAAVAATALGYKGTSTKVDSTSRPAAKNKTIVIISAGQAADSNSVPSDGALEAAQAIGWHASIYDAGLNPSKY